MIMQSVGSFMSYGMNRILLTFSSTAATVFGVYFKLQSFVFMPIFGLNNGVIPIVAYNLEAGNRKRLLQTVKLGIIYAVCLMALGWFLAQCSKRWETECTAWWYLWQDSSWCCSRWPGFLPGQGSCAA